jgi:hypothetical protein
MGGIARQVTTHGGVNQVGIWAPDSDRLAYMSTGTAAGRFEIRTGRMSAPGESRVVLVSEKPCYPEHYDGEHIVMWRQGDDLRFTPWLLETSTGREVQLGTPHKDADARKFLVDLNETGKQWVDSIFPGGRYPYSDGELQAAIYRLSVDGLLRAGFSPVE